MSLFSTLVEEEGVLEATFPDRFWVSGSSQLRMGIYYIDNEFTADVFYKETDTQAHGLSAEYRVTNLLQNNKSFSHLFFQALYAITSDLKVALDSQYQVTKILNHPSIPEKWLKNKDDFLKKYSYIPDIEEALSNYEANIQDEEKLRDVIFYHGISAAFFPRIKGIVQHTEEGSVTERIRIFSQYVLGMYLPVKEVIRHKKENGKIRVEIDGSIDYDRLDSQRLLAVCKRMYEKDVRLDEISLTVKENYILSDTLSYEEGELFHHFFIRGRHFKTDKLAYRINK